jgi:hypothetical protein
VFSIIGAHDTDGFLGVGIHTATWSEASGGLGSTLVGWPYWNVRTWRWFTSRKRSVRVYLACSSVNTKAVPGDLDVAWDVTGVDVEMIHPMFLDLTPESRSDVFWTFAGDYSPAQGVEAHSGATFVDSFQRTREGRPVGIFEIDLSTVE